jgi:hypothetical protein
MSAISNSWWRPIGKWPALLLTLAALFSSSTYPLAAQTFDADAYSQKIIDAGNNTIAFVLKKFKPHIANEHHYLLSTEKISVEVYADFNAFANYQRKTIIIPAQLVSEMFAQVQAMIYIKNRPNARQHYGAWMQYLTKRSNDVLQRFKRKEADVDDVPVHSLWAFAGLPAPSNLNQQDEVLQEQMLVDAMGLIVGHELGHLVLRHRSYAQITPQDAQKQEYAADDFAAQLMRSAGLSVIPGLITVYSRFAFTDAMFATYRGATNTHPPGPCRLYRLFKSELDRIRTSHQSRRDFERGSGMGFDQLESFMNATRRECGL